MQAHEGPAGTLGELRRRILEEAKAPGGKALEAAETGRAVLLAGTEPQLWVVLGEEADYIVVPLTYCSCPHFTIRVIGERDTKPCYHIVAVEAVRRGVAGRLVAVEPSRSEVADILAETLLTGRSRTLRRLLHGDADPRRYRAGMR